MLDRLRQTIAGKISLGNAREETTAPDNLLAWWNSAFTREEQRYVASKLDVRA